MESSTYLSVRQVFLTTTNLGYPVVSRHFFHQEGNSSSHDIVFFNTFFFLVGLNDPYFVYQDFIIGMQLFHGRDVKGKLFEEDSVIHAARNLHSNLKI